MYDVFVSYARIDDLSGDVRAFIKALASEYELVAERNLRVFFDTDGIHSMEQWELRIKEALRQSRLLIVCRSLAYFASKWCRLEWHQFIEHERDLGLPGEAIASVFLSSWSRITPPSQGDPQLSEWITDLNARQQIDLTSHRPFENKELNRLPLRELSTQIHDRLERSTRRIESPTTIPRHNPNFCGRVQDLRTLRQMLFGGRIGSVAIVHGLGGVGKSALVFEYSHLTAQEYPGGRWLTTCDGHGDLQEVFLQLTGPLRITLNGYERVHKDVAFSKICAEIARRGRALIVLDNVNRAELLDPIQLDQIDGERIHLLATSRLSPSEIRNEKRASLELNVLPLADSVRLLEKHRKFIDAGQRSAAEKIAIILDGFPLTVEVVAAYLRAEPTVDFVGVLHRLASEGFAGIEKIASGDQIALTRHRDKLLSVTLASTFALLNPVEKHTVVHAAYLPHDAIPLPWLKDIVEKSFTDASAEAATAGYVAPWDATIKRLDGLGLFSFAADARIRRMHRLVAACLIQDFERETARPTRNNWFRRLISRPERLKETPVEAVIAQIERRINLVCQKLIPTSVIWELEPLRACAQMWLNERRSRASWLADRVSRPLIYVMGDFIGAQHLLRQAVELLKEQNTIDNMVRVDGATVAIWLLLATVERRLHHVTAARQYFNAAAEIALSSLPPDDPALVELYMEHAALENDAKNYENGIDLSFKALAIEKKKITPETWTVARILTSLSSMFLKLGVRAIFETEDLTTLEEVADKSANFGGEAVLLLLADKKINAQELAQASAAHAGALLFKKNTDSQAIARISLETALKMLAAQGLSTHPDAIDVHLRLATLELVEDNLQAWQSQLTTAKEIAEKSFGIGNSVSRQIEAAKEQQDLHAAMRFGFFFALGLPPDVQGDALNTGGDRMAVNYYDQRQNDRRDSFGGGA
jgi:TIR domain/NB-ARC domain